MSDESVFDSDDVDLLLAEMKSMSQNIATIRNIAVGYVAIVCVVIGASVIFTLGSLSS